MASFIERIMSGDYPILKEIFEKDYFGKIADEVFGDPLGNVADGDDCTSDRCRLKLESAMREITLLKADKTEAEYRLNVIKGERDDLKQKLADIRSALGHL